MTKKVLGLVSPLLLATVLSAGLAPGFAQTNTAQQTKPATPAQSSTTAGKGWVRDPNSVMPMRKMTNAEHRAAAQRNKVRRQNDVSRRLQRSRNSKGGVQQ
jgi:GH24 family phage-related lysozyme (muramidase)